MNTLSKWLREKGMAQFTDRYIFGYKFSARPGDTDAFRKWLVIPRLGILMLPYLNGSDLGFELKVSPTKDAFEYLAMKCTFYLTPKDEGLLKHEGHHAPEIITNPLFNTPYILLLGHFPFTGEWVLDIEVEMDGKKERQSIANFEFKSLATAATNLWLILLTGILTGIVGFILGRR